MKIDQYNNDMVVLDNVKKLKEEILDEQLVLKIKLARVNKRLEKCDLFIDEIEEKYGDIDE